MLPEGEMMLPEGEMLLPEGEMLLPGEEIVLSEKGNDKVSLHVRVFPAADALHDIVSRIDDMLDRIGAGQFGLMELQGLIDSNVLVIRLLRS